MAIRFIDSFSHYDTPNIYTKWTTPQSETARFASGTIVPGSGRCLQNALYINRFSDTTAGTGPCLLVAPALTEGVVGVGVKYPDAGVDAPAGMSIFLVKLNGVLFANTQLEVMINSDGTIRVITYDGFFNIIELGRTTFPMQAGSWHYVELVFKIHSTLGVAQIYIDGQQKLNLTNVNTVSGTPAANFWSVIQLGTIYPGHGLGGFCNFCDFYVGDAQTDRKGDVRAFTRLPNSDGTYRQWIPLLVGPHYQMVDDNPPDDDTTYNFTSTVGAIDTYTYPPVAVPSGIIYAVQVLPRLKKDDVGTRSAAPFIRQAGSDYVGVTQAIAAGQYLYYRQLYELDPTGAAWTVATANADEFGVKLIE